jgi:integrase
VSSIDKRPNGSWRARWREPGGRQRAQHFPRKIDAQQHLASITVDLARGAYIDPDAGRVTVEEYGIAWMAAQPWRASTRDVRERVWRDHVVPHLGHLQLRQLRPSDVQAWVGMLSTSGAAASSVDLYYRTLASVMRSASRDKLVHESPCAGIRLPSADRPSSALVPLTVEQVQTLADEVPDRYRALVLVSAGLGLRQGEACGLTVDRVDFLRRRVTISRQVVTGKTSADHAFGPVKTAASNRTIPLPVSVADVLAAHLAEFGEGADRLIFVTSEGTMVGRQAWSTVFKSATRRRGIDASSHDLRHHCASLLIAAGCSPRAVASFLGHKSAATTLDTYAHLWPSDEGRITEAIDAGFRPSEDYLRTTGTAVGS